MRFFNNPRDRKALELNEKQAYEALVKHTEHERMESESADSGRPNIETTTSQEEVQTPTQKARKKKADKTL